MNRHDSVSYWQRTSQSFLPFVLLVGSLSWDALWTAISGRGDQQGSANRVEAYRLDHPMLKKWSTLGQL